MNLRKLSKLVGKLSPLVAVPLAIDTPAQTPPEALGGGVERGIALSDLPAGPVEGIKLVRRDAHGLNPEGPEIAALRRGFAELQRRSRENPSDPTGLTFQANIHGTPDGNPLTEWNACPHGGFYFLSWHRMYLYWFERILRAASGEPRLTIPYWDYEKTGQRAIPLPFRVPADPSNSLFVRERNRGINDGAELPESMIFSEAAFVRTNFVSTPGFNLSFGGPITREPEHFTRSFGLLEAQPHNNVHNYVGGPHGWMSAVATAARDPIFWCHHANIDRLWKRWLNRGEGRGFPGREGDEGRWWTREFVFFNEEGQRVAMTGAQIVDTVAQLGYRYDDDSEERPGGERGVPVLAMGGGEATTTRTNLVWAESESGIELGREPVTAAIELLPIVTPGEVEGTLAHEAPSISERVVLTLEGITFDQNPGVGYEVYVGLPPGEPPVFTSPFFVGGLGFFAPGPHEHADLLRSFDITEAVRKVIDRGGWEGRLDVMFVMRGLVPPAPAGGIDVGPTEEPRVRIEHIEVTYE